MKIEFREDTRGWTKYLIFVEGQIAGDVSVNDILYITEWGERFEDEIVAQLKGMGE